MIEQIEDLGAELQTMTLGAQHKILVHREIHVRQSRTAHDVAACIAKLPSRRRDEGASIKPARWLVDGAGGQPALRDRGVAGGGMVCHSPTGHVWIWSA